MLAIVDSAGESVRLYRRINGTLMYWRTVTGDASALRGAIAAARSLCTEVGGDWNSDLRLFSLHNPEPVPRARIGPGIHGVCRVNGALGKLKRPRGLNR
jgi:hypothetical protein